MTLQIDRVRAYLAAREALPMPHLGDIIHAVNLGSEYAGALLLSDLRAFVASHDAMVKALENVSSTYNPADYRPGCQERRLGDLAREALKAASS